VEKRLAEYNSNPGIAMDFDASMEDIDKEL
jgi:hypothetical protein